MELAFHCCAAINPGRTARLQAVFRVFHSHFLVAGALKGNILSVGAQRAPSPAPLLSCHVGNHKQEANNIQVFLEFTPRFPRQQRRSNLLHHQDSSWPTELLFTFLPSLNWVQALVPPMIQAISFSVCLQ